MITFSIHELSLYLMGNIGIYYFFDKLLARRFHNPVFIPLTVVFNSVIIVILPSYYDLKILLSVVFLSLGCLSLYHTKIYLAVALSITYIYLLSITDIIIGNLVSIIVSYTHIVVLDANVFRTIIICLFIKALGVLAFYFVYRRFKKTNLYHSKKYWILYSTVIFVFLVISVKYMLPFTATPNSLYSKMLYPVLSIFFFFTSLIVIYFFSYVLESIRNKQKYILLRSTYEAATESLLIQQQYSSKLRKLKHDIKNHITLASTLMEQGKPEEAVAALKSTIQRTDDINIHIQNSSGNSIIDAIIASKAAIAKNLGVQFNYALDKLPEFKMDILDLSSILSNLIDNAIEAALLSPEPYIEIKIVWLDSYLSIFEKNSCSPVSGTDYSSKRITSTKKEEHYLHGLGMQIISEIAEKYSGTFNWNLEAGVFKSNVLLLKDSIV